MIFLPVTVSLPHFFDSLGNSGVGKTPLFLLYGGLAPAAGAPLAFCKITLSFFAEFVIIYI